MSTFKLSKLDQVPAGPRTTAPPPPTRGSRLTQRIVSDGRWWDRAACKGLDGPLRGGRGSVWIEPGQHPRAVVDMALRVCRECPVRDACGRDRDDLASLSRNEVAGIWAGESRSPGGSPRTLKTCKVCGAGFTSTSRDLCSAGCYHVGVRKRSNLFPASDDSPPGPLLAFFGDTPVQIIAERCGVTRRTVSRWRAGFNVQSPAWIASNIGVDTRDIWGQSL